MSEFESKRFVVTGASSGIGHAVAEQLLAAGAEVVCLDRNAPTAKVNSYVEVDLADQLSIENAVGQLDGTFDGLMHVAGAPGTAPARVVVAVNSLAVVQLTELFIEKLRPGGTVTIVSSTAGLGWPARLHAIEELLSANSFEEGAAWLDANPLQGDPDNFSKEASTVYAMSMGLTMARVGLRINAVLPGPVDAPIMRDFEDTAAKDNLDLVKDLVRRYGTAECIAGAVVFLASDAARWINGHALVVDGGITGAVMTGTVPTPAI